MSGKHKEVSCKICYKSMRSDSVKRHMKVHEKPNKQICGEVLDGILDNMFVQEESTTEIKHDDANKVVELEDHPTTKRKFDGEQYTQDDQPSIKRKCGENMIDVDELRKTLIERTDEYNRKVALGEQVYIILGEGEVKQGALPKDMQEALELYEKENNDFDLYKDTALYPWQQECMKYINNKSDREVYWIVGQKTNEGKSFFQKYIKAMFGANRVVSGINLKTSSKNICQSLRKYPLATADIFLFNLGKTKKYYEDINYGILEDLKDGSTFAEKYDSQNLKIRTPNIIMIFSNHFPDKKELASDRWKIFSIKNSELSGQEKSELSGQEKRQVERVKYDSDSDSVYSTSDSY